MVADPGRIPNVRPVGQNGFTLDMFGRLKVGEGYSLFDSQHRYTDNGHFSNEGSGTYSVGFLPLESTATLNVGTASGDRVSRESYRVFPYQPGKSLQILQTFVLAPPKENLRQRVGYFTRENGIYLEQDGTDIYMVKRQNVTGEVLEVRVPQSDWNIDVLDGSGKTDIRLDLTKGQIMFIEIEWLGIGSVRTGFIINGVPIVVHRFDHSNLIDSVYMTTAALALRYELENTGPTSSASVLKQVCASVTSNGGFFKSTTVTRALRESATVGTTYYPVVAIRLAPGREDAVILPSSVDIFPTSTGDFDYGLVRLRDGETVTGGTWVTQGSVQYNISATSYTGGEVLLDGFFGATNQAITPTTDGDVRNFAYQLGRTNAATPASDVMVLAVKASTGTGTLKATLGWFDLL